MDKNSVNTRFVESYNELLQENFVVSKKDFAEKLDISQQKLSEILNYRMGVTTELLQKFFSVFPVNVEYMFNGKGGLLEGKMRPNMRPNVRPNDNFPSILPESQGNIFLLDSKAAAGFGAYVDRPEYYSELSTFSLPFHFLRHGQYICMEVTGDSMHPTVKDKEWVIGERITEHSNIISGYVYLLITTDTAVCKRLYYETKAKNIELVSDNETYTAYNIPTSEVVAIYRSVMRLSSDFRNWQSDLRKDIRNLNDRITNLETLAKRR
jgi:hypothetical protein